MGHVSRDSGLQFDLSDLGLLDSQPVREFDVVTRDATFVLHVRATYFFVSEHTSLSALCRSQHSRDQQHRMQAKLPLVGSICELVTNANSLLQCDDIHTSDEFPTLRDAEIVPFTSFMSAPVHGPAGEPIGALTVVCARARTWTQVERADLLDHAHLLSRQILLKATLETLKRVSRERDELRQIPQFRN